MVLVEGEGGIGKSALLTRFLGGLAETRVLRASGEESEALLAYGLVSQLLASAGLDGAQAASGNGRAGPPPAASADPLAVGADLVALLGQLQDTGTLVVVAVDDLHWADRRSALALLFALRRMQGDRVLGLLTARPAELAGLGDGWGRFVAGDYRASRLRLDGLAAREISALGRALGTAEVSPRAAARLREYTGGSPLYCRALLEETSPQDWAEPDGLPAPPGLAGIILARVRALSPAARDLVQAAAVLGRSSSLTAAAILAGLPDPVPAFDEAVSAGLVAEERRADGNRVMFAHPLVHGCVYNGLGPASRRGLHRRAAELAGSDEALSHRFAAAAGYDAGLAADLAEAGQRAIGQGRMAQAAAWLAQASAASPLAGDRDRLLLDSLAVLVGCGDVAGAEALAARVTAIRPSARRSALLGHLDLVAGRAQDAQARLTEAWQTHDPSREPLVAAQAAYQMLFFCGVSGRVAESIVWGERAVHAAAGDPVLRQHALGALAISLASDQRAAEALDRLDFLAASPAEVPPGLTDVLINRGMARVLSEDLPMAVADLSVAAGRIGDGVPLRYASQCLGYLAEAEYRLGAWDDAVLHGELAVSLATDAGRTWDFSFVHGFATLVPAARGDWDVAADHVEAAGSAARAFGAGLAVTAWASARAALAAARGDHEEVLRAAASVRATGRAGYFGRLGLYPWLVLEIEALLGLADLDGAARALAEFQAPRAAASPASSRMTSQWLSGALAAERGDAAGSARAFAAAWGCARGLALPLRLARLEMADGRRLRQSGRRPEAIARLRSARERLVSLGARPYLAACDQELAASGVQLRPEVLPETIGLTPSELAVARLVAMGLSNREAAAELYVSVKAIEFHLSNIFSKLAIHSRGALAERLAAPQDQVP